MEPEHTEGIVFPGPLQETEDRQIIENDDHESKSDHFHERKYPRQFFLEIHEVPLLPDPTHDLRDACVVFEGIDAVRVAAEDVGRQEVRSRIGPAFAADIKGLWHARRDLARDRKGITAIGTGRKERNTVADVHAQQIRHALRDVDALADPVPVGRLQADVRAFGIDGNRLKAGFAAIGHAALNGPDELPAKLLSQRLNAALRARRVQRQFVRIQELFAVGLRRKPRDRIRRARADDQKHKTAAHTDDAQKDARFMRGSIANRPLHSETRAVPDVADTFDPRGFSVFYVVLCIFGGQPLKRFPSGQYRSQNGQCNDQQNDDPGADGMADGPVRKRDHGLLRR